VGGERRGKEKGENFYEIIEKKRGQTDLKGNDLVYGLELKSL